MPTEEDQPSRTQSGREIIERLKAEPFNQTTEERLYSHPYLRAAEEGTLTLNQRQAFAVEQYYIQLSDAASFASLAGHSGFLPASLTDATTPDPVHKHTHRPDDLFQFLLAGEIYAAPLLLKYANGMDLTEETLRSSFHKTTAIGQAYPSYWARLALSQNRAAGAAACAVNFPAWGEMCRRLWKALGDTDTDSNSTFGYDGTDDEGLAFVKFFATLIDTLEEMAASVIDEEGVAYEDIVDHVRLLQEYEVMFW
eukprot:CAMPEP_0194360092 /NCGR_PEP_ID=MMETSP0174-20130528/7391_1 /TAXON_ID=216777 /ORGANISM="Proboscia alata, Strain PI-D3" /LENGTH=252 /DNA_ID=CAMNT_0039131377 /DNA_START=114 /DNA_END=869 /DNA_ORIENTATION=-